MTKGSQVTQIMKNLKRFMINGTKSDTEHIMYNSILRVLGQLKDDELQFVYTKYVNLFEMAINKNGQVKLVGFPSPKQIKSALSLNQTEYVELSSRTYKQVINLFNIVNDSNNQYKKSEGN